MRPDQLARNGSESSEQRALFCWSALKETRLIYPELIWMFAIPNGKQRSIIDGANLKAEGVKAGVPDIFLPAKRAQYGGLFIELKRVIGGQVNEQQSVWLENLTKLGYCAKVCRGWLDAKMTIESYLQAR